MSIPVNPCGVETTKQRPDTGTIDAQPIPLGSYRCPVLGDDGQPVLATPSNWKGPIVERLAIPEFAECGPQFTGMPVICTSITGKGRRWYKVGGRLAEIPAPANGIDFLSATYERDYERWECQPGNDTLVLRMPSSTLELWLHEEARGFDLETRYAHKDEVLTYLMSALAGEMQSGMPSGRLLSEGLAMAICGWVHQRYTLTKARGYKARGVLNAGQQKAIREFIDANVGDSLSLELMASELGISPTHFLRLFRTTYGTTPHHFVLQTRLDRAAQVLRNERHKCIADVAMETGFASQAHLTSAFKRKFGETPANWRRLDS